MVKHHNIRSGHDTTNIFSQCSSGNQVSIRKRVQTIDHHNFKLSATVTPAAIWNLTSGVREVAIHRPQLQHYRTYLSIFRTLLKFDLLQLQILLEADDASFAGAHLHHNPEI
jgi:hypothetical protein